MEKYAIVSFIFSDGRSSVGPVITVPPDTVSSFRRAGSRDEYLDVFDTAEEAARFRCQELCD